MAGKMDLAEAVTREFHELTGARSEEVITMLFESITEKLGEGEPVLIEKFGTFNRHRSQTISFEAAAEVRHRFSREDN